MGPQIHQAAIAEPPNQAERAPKVCARGLSKSFTTDGNRLEIFSNIDLNLFQEDILCLLGPSGCGKSTVLKILAGLMLPDTGLVTMDSEPVLAPAPERAVVFQEDAVFPWMTVRKNVEYGLAARGIPAAERRETSDYFLEITGLTDYASYYPRQLSGGMKKRVDLARAYANGPEVLLMDESFGSLDVITKEQMQQDLLSLLETHRLTVLFVTHDIEEALFLGDRVAVMQANPGRISEMFTTPFPRPRESHLRMSPEFQDLRARVHDLILS